MTSIDSFPDDDIERVVYLYSCLKLNTSSESDNILIEVLLVEIDAANINRLKISENSYNKYDVTFRDLDTVQIGSIWKGQTRIDGRIFTFNNCLRSVDFEFDFSINKPKVIRFDDKIPDSEEYYLYNEKIFIPKNEYDNNVPFKFYPLLMSKYCILKSNDNIEVLTSCIHSLHAFYIPARKDIRGHIINENYSISHIVDLFLDKYEIQHNENGDRLSVVMKNIVKTIGKEAITLLANLALNKNTQEKILNIRNSLNDVKFDKTGKPYPSRFPSVIPPHSTTMHLTAEGIWLENGKRFLITHVSKVSPIADYPIVAYAPVTESEEQVEIIDKEKIHRKGRNKKKRKNTRINTQEDPSHNRGENKKQTDISVDFTDFDIEIIEEVSEIESNIQYIESKEKNKNNNNEESSGNRYGNRKNKPQKSENSEKKPNKLEVDDLALIFNSLKNIEAKKDSTKLAKVSCVNQKGNLSDTFSLLQIKSIVKFPIHNTWINDDVGRSLLFLKLELADFHDHLYLIDIKKNNKNNEAFCFFLFTTKEMLNEKNITMICEAIEGKKGTKKWFDICKTNFNQKRAMKHMHTVQSDWIDSFSKIFNTLIKKKKL